MAAHQPCSVFPPQWKQIYRCTHCNVQSPNLTIVHQVITNVDAAPNFGAKREYNGWATYCCASCAGIILVTMPAQKIHNGEFLIHASAPATAWPREQSVSDDIPERARRYLSQAISSLAQPDASILVAGSSVDAMLKAKGLNEGSLYKRIEEARNSGLITSGMADWANEVRLAANDQRHADENSEHNTLNDAKRLVDFTLALGEFLFVLPAKVQRGRKTTPA